MWFTDVTLETIRKRLKPLLPWRDMLRRPVPAQEINRGPMVKETVTREEFTRRYAHLRQAMLGLILMMAIDLVVFIAVSGLLWSLICLAVFLLYALFYFRYGFTAWVARWIWTHWDRRHEPAWLTLRMYLDALGADPAELMPRPLTAHE